MTTTVGTKFSTMSTKLQVGTAAVAVAAAAAITPAVAHAAPSLPSFAEGLGNSAQLLVDPTVIIPSPTADVAAPSDHSAPGANKKVTASASPSPIEIFVAGLGEGLTNVIKGTVQYWGSFVYGGLAFTGTVLNILGPNPIGNAFLTAANNVAKAIKIGPYSTSA